MKNYYLYRLLRTVFTPIFKFVYRPQIVNSQYVTQKVKIDSQNNSQILAGNHKHALDPILVDICTKRIVFTLAKKDLHDGPFGFLFKAIGTIPVDLHNTTNKSALDESIKKLKDGCLINLSPEAKRNYTNEILLPFKYGAVSMAKKTNSPIVPYAITGDYKLFSKNLKIVFGEPIDVSNLDIEKANEILFYSIRKLLEDNMEKEELNTKIISEYKGVARERTKDTWT